MILGEGALGLMLFGLWIFCIIDVITTDESQIRNLPKLAWVFIVLLLVDIGSILWLVAGRNWSGGPRRAPVGERVVPAYPEYNRAGRAAATSPDDDEEFLSQVRARAEAQRREYQARRRAELDEEQRRLTKRPDDETS